MLFEYATADEAAIYLNPQARPTKAISTPENL